MAQDRIHKTLAFKRCYFPDGFNGSMENIVTGIKENLPEHKDREYAQDLLRSYIVSDISDNQINGKGKFVSIYAQDRGATGLINLEQSKEIANVEEYKAPEKKAWLEHEILLLVVENHIVACNMGARDKFLSTMITDIAKKADAANDDLGLRISDVPNKTEIARIQEVGVKNIDLSLNSYLTSLDAFPNADKKQEFLSILERVFSNPDEAKDIKRRANTSGRLILRRGRFKKDEIKKDDWLTKVGEDIVQGEMEEYKITLEDNSIVSTSKLKVTKPVFLNRHANSFSKEQAQRELVTYYEDLKDNGSLNW